MARWPVMLDDAILIVLHDRPDRTAAIAHISERINRRRLYVHKDGTGVFPSRSSSAPAARRRSLKSSMVRRSGPCSRTGGGR
jgi:hypothetical protein